MLGLGFAAMFICGCRVTAPVPTPAAPPALGPSIVIRVAPADPEREERSAAGVDPADNSAIDGAVTPERENVAPTWEPATSDAYAHYRSATGDAMVVYFAGPTCAPCRTFERTVLGVVEDTLLDEVGVLLRDDSGGASELARAFRVTSTPSVFFVRGDQMRRFERQTLPRTPDKFLAAIRAADRLFAPKGPGCN